MDISDIFWQWITYKTRSLTQNGQECAEIMQITDNIMCEVDF